MAILLHPSTRVDQWTNELTALLPDEEIRVWPEVGDLSEIDYLVSWVMSGDDLAKLTGLQAILCLGAGTEQWQKPGIPDVPIVRLVDTEMANEMAAYALAWVIRHQRDFAQAELSQRVGEWKIPPHPQPYEYRVGVLGYGEIGSRIGRAFADLGYPVNAWTRSSRADPNVTQYCGIDQLEAFLSQSDAVINVLPSTGATRGLLNAARFEQFADGALFINVGRGSVIADEVELVDALDTGPLAAAVLDVTSPEPPAQGSPLYTHPGVTLTAHLSGTTQVRSASKLIAANINRLRAGEDPFPILDRARGY